jgi:glycosyltransferase involved in cell wall biosynthesis
LKRWRRLAIGGAHWLEDFGARWRLRFIGPPPPPATVYEADQNWRTIFDPEWYLGRNPDVRASGVDPLQHFLSSGSQQGRDPHPLFDTAWYARNTPELETKATSAFSHFINVGVDEGRDPHPLFDIRWYNARRKTPRSSPLNPLAVFIHYGANELHSPHPLFSTEWYLRRNPDVAEAKLNPLLHYVTVGAKEGRDPHPLFDTDWYVERYPEADPAKINPLVHYLEIGADKGYDPGPFFDTEWYLDKYPEARASGLNPLLHFVTVGGTVGFDPSPRFDHAWYVNRYPDVRNYGHPPWQHFFFHGWSEGRQSRGGTYQDWVATFDKLGNADIAYLKRRARENGQLKFTLVTTRRDEAAFQQTRHSLEEQLFPNWELLVVTDPETEPGEPDPDDRIKTVIRAGDSDVEGFNIALSKAKGDFISLLNEGDLLSSDTLVRVADRIAAQPETGIVFSDEDLVDSVGIRQDPQFKCTFNPALMQSTDMLGNSAFFRTALVRRAGGMRTDFAGAESYDLKLRCLAELEPTQVAHIPRVLYHSRMVRKTRKARSLAREARVGALADHLQQTGVQATVSSYGAAYSQVSPRFDGPWPRVTILMPSACKLEVITPNLTKILEETTYPDFEVRLIVSSIRFYDDDKANFLQTMSQDPRVKLCVYKDRPFNFAWINNFGEQNATGSVLCFMNDDVEITQPDWLQMLVSRLTTMKNVAAVGPFMYYPNGTIQHSGVIVGLGRAAGHIFLGAPGDSIGLGGRALLEQDLSAVTAACMVMWRDEFQQIGRFDETLAVAYNDIDLCLKLRERGRRIIFTPEAVMCHQESVSIGFHASPERFEEYMRELRYFQDKWKRALDDPFYNPNLDILTTEYILTFPPRREEFMGYFRDVTPKPDAMGDEPLDEAASEEEAPPKESAAAA